FGRHTKTSWGPLISNRIAWFVMELPALIIMPMLALAGGVNIVVLVLAGLWTAHYFNRACVFPFRIRTAGKKMPLVICLMAFGFNLFNGFLCGYYIGSDFGNGLGNGAQYDLTYFMRPHFIIGILVFCGGALLNIYSDNILINLRKKSTDTGQKEYVIPTAGPFRYVSCPNLLGEIIEWCGFAIMTIAFPFFAFALWTIANLLPRALSHHKWYHSKFPDYPPKRKAIIPFIL
ncbi:MAG: DUF1295 domain-containing protein, partial [Candidatus Portiera sp.]|nr:DUF1295 domain-containing protein [Portiera sp.]